MNSFKSLLLLMALFVGSIACSLATPKEDGDAVTLPGCYDVSFLGVEESTDTVSTWRYRVEEQSCAQDLSNWMLELPVCAVVIDASPSPWEVVQPDPNYQFDGIKWETGTGFESGEFSVVLSGELMTGSVRVGVKGPDVAIAEIAGPVCDPLSDTLTPTVFSGTISPTSVESTATASALPPTVTVPAETVAPPPASSGTILITDNAQTLTFTCNGNAVEVRGNANVITLLGSCSSITVRGNANQVYWQSGSPVITDTGNENIISQR